MSRINVITLDILYKFDISFDIHHFVLVFNSAYVSLDMLVVLSNLEMSPLLHTLKHMSPLYVYIGQIVSKNNDVYITLSAMYFVSICDN